MQNGDVLNTDVLRARIIEFEYKKITVEDIKRIYIEESGEQPHLQTLEWK